MLPEKRSAALKRKCEGTEILTSFDIKLLSGDRERNEKEKKAEEEKKRIKTNFKTALKH